MKNMSWQLVSMHKAETKTSRTRSGRAEQLNSNVWLKESLTAWLPSAYPPQYHSTRNIKTLFTGLFKEAFFRNCEIVMDWERTSKESDVA
jgi:hypothetical protein